MGQYTTLQQSDKMCRDVQWNDMNKETAAYQTMEEEEQQQQQQQQNLSQRMSQLSTHETNTEEVMLFKDIKIEIEKIPDYLTKKNQSFKHLLNQVLSTIIRTESNTTNKIQELRIIAILIYKIMVIQIYQLLWTTYLKSGLGKLIIPLDESSFYSTIVPIWPKELKILLSSSSKINKTNENEIYLKFVTEQLYKLEHQLKQYQNEIHGKTKQFDCYTLVMQETIQTYIEQHLSSFRLKIEHQIELIHYDYHIRALKLEYFQCNPVTYQKQSMNQICQSKYKQEATEQKYHLLKQIITYYNSPSQSFDSSSVAYPLLSDSINDQEIRRNFAQQYKTIVEQCRATLFAIYMESAEDQREEYKKKYEADVKKIFSSQHSLNSKEKLSAIMIHLINERCTKICERIRCIYKFKTQSFLSKS